MEEVSYIIDEHLYEIHVETMTLFNPPCFAIQIKKVDVHSEDVLFKVCLMTHSSNPLPQVLIMETDVYVAYQSLSKQQPVYVLVKLNQLGQIQWVKTHPRTLEISRLLLKGVRSHVIVCQVIGSLPSSHLQAQIDHFDTQGQLIQTLQCTHSCQGLRPLDVGIVVIIETDLIWICHTSEKFYVFKFSLEDGSLIWSRSYQAAIKHMIWTFTKHEPMLYILTMGDFPSQWNLFVINSQGQLIRQVIISSSITEVAHKLIMTDNNTNHFYILVRSDQDLCLEFDLEGHLIQKRQTPQLLHDLFMLDQMYVLVSQRYHPKNIEIVPFQTFF